MKLLQLLFGVLVIANCYAAPEWTGKQCATLFCPGILSSELQATKYCPVYGVRRGLCDGNDDYAALIETFHNNTIFDGTRVWACNFREMIPAWKSNLEQRTLLSVNRLISECAQRVAKKVNALFGPYKLINNNNLDPQHTSDRYLNFYLDWSRLNFGQDKDVACLKDRHCVACKDLLYEKLDLVGFGFSRGAAALFNYVALCYEQNIQDNLEYGDSMLFKALVFEACPMNIATFMSLPNLLFLEKTTTFKKDGICPERLIKQFAQVCKRQSIPLLFICSIKDEVVPYKQTLKMCRALKAQGVKNIHLVVLKQSPHNAYLFHNAADRTTYHKAIHRFYKKFALSFIEFWTNQEDNDELIQIS